jgi:L-fucose isomerase-like protein
MKIGIISFNSSFADAEMLDKTLRPFVEEIEERAGCSFVEVIGDDLDRYDMVISFVKTGGTENLFKEVYKKIGAPYVILSTDNSNSLAASMEILSFLKQNGLKGEILHGNPNYIATRIKILYKVVKARKKLRGARFGIVGKPSDWLIASDVDYEGLYDKAGIELVDITIKELKHEINNKHKYENKYVNDLKGKKFDEKEIEDALYIYGALKFLTEKYNLSGLTLRCFDLLGDDIHNTGCLALSILNGEGIPAGCEGDIPALISMAIIHYLTDNPVFMANPSKIDVEENKIVFAHCTLPINMPESYELDTHFESGIGVALRGKISLGDATVFKASGDLESYFVSGCEIQKNLSQNNLCRSQIELLMNKDVNYFLRESIGNHHLIVNGNYTGLVDEFFMYL